MIKNYFRILKKPHAYLHTILKTPVKFQKDWTETVGGVKGTKYPLKTRNHAPRTTHHAPRATRHGKPKTVSLHFSSKRRGTISTGCCHVSEITLTVSSAFFLFSPKEITNEIFLNKNKELNILKFQQLLVKFSRLKG